MGKDCKQTGGEAIILNPQGERPDIFFVPQTLLLSGRLKSWRFFQFKSHFWDGPFPSLKAAAAVSGIDRLSPLERCTLKVS